MAVAITASSLVMAGCGSKGEAKSGGAASSGTLAIGASLSLTGALAREGQLTKEGYQLCQDKVNAKGGVDIGGTKVSSPSSTRTTRPSPTSRPSWLTSSTTRASS